MSVTNSQQLSIQITDCPRTEAVAPFFRMEGTEWWRHNTPLILLCETLERENATLRATLDAQMKYQRDLRADRDRLDWLDDYGYEYDGLIERGWGIGLPSNQKSNTRNLRAAIDAAKKEAQP